MKTLIFVGKLLLVLFIISDFSCWGKKKPKKSLEKQVMDKLSAARKSLDEIVSNYDKFMNFSAEIQKQIDSTMAFLYPTLRKMQSASPNQLQRLMYKPQLLTRLYDSRSMFDDLNSILVDIDGKGLAAYEFHVRLDLLLEKIRPSFWIYSDPQLKTIANDIGEEVIRDKISRMYLIIIENLEQVINLYETKVNSEFQKALISLGFAVEMLEDNPQLAINVYKAKEYKVWYNAVSKILVKIKDDASRSIYTMITAAESRLSIPISSDVASSSAKGKLEEKNYDKEEGKYVGKRKRDRKGIEDDDDEEEGPFPGWLEDVMSAMC